MEPGGRVFVYGTLMPGEPRWAAIRPHVTGLEPMTARGQLFDTGHGYPAARFDRPGEIRGWALTLRPTERDDALALLDRIEGDLYRRIDVPLSDGATALTYEWAGGLDALTPLDGDWTARDPRSGS